MDSFAPFIGSNSHNTHNNINNKTNMDHLKNGDNDEIKNVYINTLKVLKSEVDEYTQDFLILIHVEIPEYKNYTYHIYGNNNFYLGGRVYLDNQKKKNIVNHSQSESDSNNEMQMEFPLPKHYFSFKHSKYNHHYFISIIIENKTYTQFYEYKKDLSPLPLPNPSIREIH